MAANYTQNTARFQKDLNRVMATPASKKDAQIQKQNRATGSKLSYSKKYDAEHFTVDKTIKFEKTLGNRNKLVKSVLPMAFDTAKYYAYRSGARASLDDLIQAASEGAIRAADEYLSTPVESQYKKKLAKFSTYAYYWIRKYAKEASDELSAIVSAPINKRQELTNQFQSGDETAYDDGNPTTVFAAGKITQLKTTMIAAAEFEDYKKQAKAVFSRLSSTNRKVLFMTYGIGYDDPLTVRQISKELGIATGSVTKIKYDALNQLRQLNIDPEVVQVLAHIEGVDLSGFQKWDESK